MLGTSCNKRTSSMAKRKNRGAQRNESANWSDEIQVSLLSWLDFSLKHKEIDFESTIVDHLKGAFTLQQIEGKLRRLWYDYGPVQVPGTPKLRPDIKTRGSLSLPHYMTADKKNDIRLAIETLEIGYDALFPTPNRRLRSISRLDTPSSNQYSRSSTTTVQKTETLQKRKRRFESESVTPSGVKNEIRQVDIGSPNTMKGRKRQKTYSKRDVRLPSHLLFEPLLMGNSGIAVLVLLHVVLVPHLQFQSNFVVCRRGTNDRLHLLKKARTKSLIPWSNKKIVTNQFARNQTNSAP